jgi:rubrerythrin
MTMLADPRGGASSHRHEHARSTPIQENTERNLKDAFAGESQAHMTYMVFADRAEREGLPNIARLFRATSFSEQIHAANHLKALGVGKTPENLDAAFGGETYEITTMYPEFMQAAEAEGEKRALTSMHDAMEAEKVHARLYTRAKEATAAGGDLTTLALFVCPVCGYTMEGEAPERCPVCNAPSSKFVTF